MTTKTIISANCPYVFHLKSSPVGASKVSIITHVIASSWVIIGIFDYVIDAIILIGIICLVGSASSVLHFYIYNLCYLYSYVYFLSYFVLFYLYGCYLYSWWCDRSLITNNAHTFVDVLTNR